MLAGVGVYNVTIVSYRQAATPPETVGRVTASMRALLLGTIPLGSMLAAGLATAFGTRTALRIAAVLGLLPAVVLLASPIRTMREFPAPAEPSPADAAQP